MIALLCGPLVGIAVHLAALARMSPGLTVYFGRHRHALPRCLDRRPRLQRGERHRRRHLRRSLRFRPRRLCGRRQPATAPATSRCARARTWCAHPVNLGQGAAIQTGVEYARSQPGAAVFATFDADGQHRVKDVVRMIDRLSAEDVDIVVGTRFADPGVVSRTPLLKRLVLRSAARLSRRSRKLGLTDAHNGLRVFNKKVADGLNITMSGMSHAERVHRAGRRKPLAGSRRTGRDSLHRLLEVEGPAAAERRQHHLRRVAAREDVAMNWIQALLIVSVVALLVYLLRSRRSARSKAWVKVGYVLFVIAGIYAILRPGRHHRRRELAWGGPRCGPDGVRADHRVRVHHAVAPTCGSRTSS